MKSNIKDGNYIILEDGDKYPQEISKGNYHLCAGVVLGGLYRLSKDLTAIENTYGDIFKLIQNHTGNFIESREEIEYAIKNLESLTKALEENRDDIKPPKMTLKDYGFNVTAPNKVWEKLVKDELDKEVVIEVVIQKDQAPLYRKRTTIWADTDFGRRSKDISYEQLPITDEFKEIIRNTTEA